MACAEQYNMSGRSRKQFKHSYTNS